MAKNRSSSSSSKLKSKSQLKKSATATPATTATTTSKIEQLVIELSKKEAEQNEKRERCSEIVDQIKFHQEKVQSLRDEVKYTMEELHSLDDEITNLQMSKDRLVALLNSGNGNSDSSKKMKENQNRDSIAADNDDGFETHNQYPKNLTQHEGDENDINCTNSYHDTNYNDSVAASASIRSAHRMESSNKGGTSINDTSNRVDHSDGIGPNSVSGNRIIRYNQNDHVPDDEINNNDIEDHYGDEHPPEYLFENDDDEEIPEHGLEPWSPPKQQQQSQIGKHREQHFGMESHDHNGSFRTWNNDSSTNIAAASTTATSNANSVSTFNHNNEQPSARGGTLDHYFKRPTPAAASTSSSTSIFPPSVQQQLNTTSSSSSATASSLNNHNFHVSQRPTAQQRNEDYLQKLSSDTFPWSNFVYDLLHNTFKIRNFRDHQKQIINCTLSGDDAFVIMRTGGYVLIWLSSIYTFMFCIASYETIKRLFILSSFTVYFSI